MRFNGVSQPACPTKPLNSGGKHFYETWDQTFNKAFIKSFLTCYQMHMIIVNSNTCTLRVVKIKLKELITSNQGKPWKAKFHHCNSARPLLSQCLNNITWNVTQESDWEKTNNSRQITLRYRNILGIIRFSGNE